MKAFAAFVALALVQTASPQPAPPATPQDCVKSAREYAMQRQRAAAPLTSDIVRKIDAERIERLTACGAQFDVETAKGRELAGLVELYSETKEPERAARALARGLAADLAGADRAELLALAVRGLLRQPKSDARNARAESYIDMLDAMPDAVLEQKIAAHASMNGYYRGDDIDAGIIKHSTWLIDARPKLPKELLPKHAGSFVSAYVNKAEALAGQGENDAALALLEKAPVDLCDLPEKIVTDRTKSILARYKLVGTAAAPIAAPVWLNRAASDPMRLEGKVTLVQFTAHWCGPCKESYPGMKRLQARFSGRPFQEIFYTQTYGYFESERDLTPEQEIARDRTYYAGYGLDIPIAIGPPPSVVVNGTRQFREDPMEKAFEVGGIPQINLIDAKGRIRLIMIGYDDANEERLAGWIEKLLTEK